MVHPVSAFFLMHHFVAIKSDNSTSIPLQANEYKAFTIVARSLQKPEQHLLLLAGLSCYIAYFWRKK